MRSAAHHWILLACLLSAFHAPANAAPTNVDGATAQASVSERNPGQTRSQRESLWQAADAGELQRLLDLLDEGTAINARNEAGNSALHLAAFRGRLPVVVALLKRGADVSLEDKGGFTALDWAAANGFDAIVAKLLYAGADIGSRDLLGNTPLSWAAANGHLEVIETLLARGADMSSANADGDTPLHLAAANGELEACALLLDRGAPLGRENNDGQTPLQIAEAEYFSDIAELLLTGTDGTGDEDVVAASSPRETTEGLATPAPVPPGRMKKKSRVLEDIRRHGGLVIGYRQAAVPFSYLGPDGKPMGYTIDLCHEVVSSIKQVLRTEDLPVRWLPVSAETRLTAIDSGEVQLDCGVTTHTLGRRELAEFSLTTFITGTKLLVNANSGIEDVGDLDGRKVAVLTATTNAKALAAAAEGARIRFDTLAVRDHPAGLRALAAGEADAYATDHILLHALLYHTANQKDYRIVGKFLSYDPYAIGLPRNDSTFKLLVDRVLSRLFRNGEIEKLYAKWFDPLKAPMPELLSSAFRLQALPE